MENVFGALSELAKCCTFGPKEGSIEIFLEHEEVRKQLCKNTMSPNDALQFAVARERGDIMYKSAGSVETSFIRGDRTPTETIRKEI